MQTTEDECCLLDPPTGERSHADQGARLGPKKGPWWVCAACRQPITPADAAIQVHGSHEHGFMNPHGLSFHIGCFAHAPGCAGIGEGSEEHTWFPGHTWQIAVCGGCGTHMGWRFRRGEGPGFHGLILAKLARASQGTP